MVHASNAFAIVSAITAWCAGHGVADGVGGDVSVGWFGGVGRVVVLGLGGLWFATGAEFGDDGDHNLLVLTKE